MSDLDIIREIEKELGIKLNQVGEIGWDTKEYVVNKNWQVNAIGLYYSGVEDLQQLSILLAQLKGLQELSMNANKIIDLEPLAQLKDLQGLSLAGNQISDLEPLAQLKGLQWLTLTGNQIIDLEPLAQLKGLQGLSLAGNQIIDLEPLAQLKGLQWLLLDRNKISKLEPLAELTRLTRLRLAKNPIKTLPRWITDFSMDIQWNEYSSGITLFDNPLESPPPEIVRQGKDAIRNYFKQIEEQDKDYLFEAKLLIIGEPGAGKTSMAWKLKDHDCDLPKLEETTQGIDVHKIDFPIHHEDFPKLTKDGVTFLNRRFRMNVWDFGGQEIYKATHRFFLNKRSLYILIADNRMEDTDFNYWLHVVEMFGGDSPLLIVQNERQARKRDLDIRSMTARFGNIKNDVLRVNFAEKKPDRLLMLERVIRQHIINLPHIGSPVPSKWAVIRDVLEHDGRHTITLNDYLELCAKYGIEERKDALVLAQYFHDIGVFLHFQDDPLLKKTIFLDSDWATNAVYKILDHPLLEEEQGRFSTPIAESIWCDEEHEFLRDELLGLMNRFYLAYEVDGSGSYIVPDKLPGKQLEYAWEKSENLHLTYDYDLFMPKGIMSQFIVEMHRFISDHDKVWKRGCLLEREGAVAEVIESYDARNIRVRISGKNKRDLMTIIADRIDSINAQYEKMQVEKMIPCNCNECRESDKPYYYRYSDLKRRIEKGRREVECGRSYEMVSVRQLIDDVLRENMIDEDKRDSQGRQKNKIFVSYSHNDKQFLQRLQTHVKVLFHQGVDVDLWNDKRIKSGDRWKDEIEKALASAGVAIMLVSTDFLASDFIVDNELPPLLQAAEEEGTTILPIIVKPCRFGKSKLAIFQSVNDPKKPLSKHTESEQDEEFLKLVDRIEELIVC